MSDAQDHSRSTVTPERGLEGASSARSPSIAAPLRIPLFRRIWVASLLSNLGFTLMSVGAGWTMTVLTPAADMVALVQTAIMLPLMLFSLGAGAIADMYDRRKVGLAALCLSLTASAGLAAMAMAGLVTPWTLLGFCFLIGGGMALFQPAWQASVSEQVSPNILPQAVALNSISFNIARSFGPAVGGLVVAAAGAAASFSATALLYIPLFAVMLAWRRVPVPSRLPPERIDRAVSAGVRYALYSHPIRTVMIRAFVMGTAGGSVSALMPLVARDLVDGGAQVYGVLLGAYGVGSVIGALCISRLRRHLGIEQAVSLSALIMAVCVAIVGISHTVLLSVVALIGAGVGWMIALTLFNVTVQMAVPRWVTGRSLAAYQAAVAGGMAVGSWLWGHVAQSHGVSAALLASAFALVASAGLAFVWRVPEVAEADRETLDLADPEVALAVTARSGPIIIEIEYRIAPEDARDFYKQMLAVRAMRLRNGAFGWSIARDVGAPDHWIERYHFPTWLDYLRNRSRNTPEEIAILELARRYHRDGPNQTVRRLLERPFGSVRWTEDAPDWGEGVTQTRS